MNYSYAYFYLQDPKVYVNTILEVHKKYNALVLVAFNNDSGFVAALDKACGRFINSNSVTKAANSSSKSPELLAKYCDLLLKKSSKNPEEAELEDTLNQVVSILFKNICIFTYKIHVIYIPNLCNTNCVHRWWYLNTSKIKMYFKSSIVRC